MGTCRKAGRGPREGIARLGLPGGLAGDCAGECTDDCTAAQGLLAAAGVLPAAADAASGADAARLKGSTLLETATRGCAASKMATCRENRNNQHLSKVPCCRSEGACATFGQSR